MVFYSCWETEVELMVFGALRQKLTLLHPAFLIILSVRKFARGVILFSTAWKKTHTHTNFFPSKPCYTVQVCMWFRGQMKEMWDLLKINVFIYCLFICLFIYFWLRWVFVAALVLPLAAASGGYSSLRCTGFSLWWLLLLRSTGSRHVGFSSCGSQAPERRLSRCGVRA